MSEWIKAGEFATRFEAEMVRARLESADIPVLIRSHEGGVFGPGFQGIIPSGVELHVPEQCLSDARAILESDRDATG